MTDRPLDERSPSPQEADGPTRDIRLSPLPPPPYHAPDDEPTDRLPPPDAPARQTTVAFDAPPADPTGPPDDDTRKWPWVLLALLPLVVIAVAGVVLALLLGGG
jgi:hypothetical protein